MGLVTILSTSFIFSPRQSHSEFIQKEEKKQYFNISMNPSNRSKLTNFLNRPPFIRISNTRPHMKWSKTTLKSTFNM